MMMSMEIAVVLMLKSSAWIAVGEAMAYQASRSTVHTIRLRIGTQMKPTIKPRETTATADDKCSLFQDSRERKPGLRSRDALRRSASVRFARVDTIPHTKDTNGHSH